MLERFLRIRRMTPSAIRPRAATPPTTPPAMAPTLVLEPPAGWGSGEGMVLTGPGMLEDEDEELELELELDELERDEDEEAVAE